MSRRSRHKQDLTVGFYQQDYDLVTWLMEELGYDTRSECVLAAVDALEKQTDALKSVLMEARDDAVEGQGSEARVPT